MCRRSILTTLCHYQNIGNFMTRSHGHLKCSADGTNCAVAAMYFEGCSPVSQSLKKWSELARKWSELKSDLIKECEKWFVVEFVAWGVLNLGGNRMHAGMLGSPYWSSDQPSRVFSTFLCLWYLWVYFYYVTPSGLRRSFLCMSLKCGVANDNLGTIEGRKKLRDAFRKYMSSHKSSKTSNNILNSLLMLSLSSQWHSP